MQPTNRIKPEPQLLIGSVVFDEKFIQQAATDSGFMRREPKKISPCNFLAALCSEAIQGSPSYNDLAARIETEDGICASRQAIANRMNESCHGFLQSVLEHVMRHKITPRKEDGMPVSFRKYTRVIVQDSTVIALPKTLFAIFSGVSNAHSAVCNARIQAVYDLLRMRFTAFSIDPYSKNDLSAAPELVIEAGDLVLRDRGYLIYGEIQRHLDAGADCIYRHKTGVTYLDPETGLPFDLLDHLRAHGRADIMVLLNNPSRTPVRLIAAPVDQATAGLRRMKAKKEMRGHAPSQAVLALMDWTIFITTIHSEEIAFKEVLALYALRWRIEVIFKSWKSHLNFGFIHRVAERQLRILIKTRLLMAVVCTNLLYGPCQTLIQRKYGKKLSLLKFINYLSKNPGKIAVIIEILSGCSEDNPAIKALARYCCYDKRKRLNFNEIWEGLS